MADRTGAKGPVIWLIPGASIMKITWLSAGSAILRCPACGASQVFSTASPPPTFVHEDDDCPILRRIEAALARYRATVEKAGTN
jgi:hypothetical protein